MYRNGDAFNAFFARGTYEGFTMTRPLTINIPHSLGREEAIRRLKRGLARATTALPMVKIEEEVWSGDQLSFKLSGMGQAAFGTAKVNDADVHLEIVLPWLLQKMGEMVQSVVRSRAQILLERK
jgi:hypothetical protein